MTGRSRFTAGTPATSVSFTPMIGAWPIAPEMQKRDTPGTLPEASPRS